MKSKIFTLFAFMLFSLIGKAQPVLGSPLPDTITYHKFNQEIYTYNDDKSIKEIKGYWYQPESAPYSRFAFKIRYIYDTNKKLKEVFRFWNENDPNGSLSESFLYNKQGLDSLQIKHNFTFSSWTGDKIFKYEYDSLNRLIVKTETNTNANASYPVNIERWEYDSNGKLYSFSHDRYDNVTSALIDKSKITYEYENNLIKFETNQHWDITKNEWVQGLRFEYIYLDNDALPDIKQFYQYNNNQYVKMNAKYEYFYADTSFTEVFRQIASYFDRSVTTLKNSKQQEILQEIVEYCPNLAIYKPKIRKVTTYLPNGALDKIIQYEISNGCTVKDTIFEESSKIIYGYKQEISSVMGKSDVGIDFKVLPNPATQTIQISEPGVEILFVNIFDTKGTIIQSHEVNSDHMLIERNGATAGLYYVQIQTEKGIVTKLILWVD